MKTFGERLRAAREAAHLTQEELGASLGVTNSSVSGWERNREVPSFQLLARLREIVGVSLDDLICGDQKYPSRVAPPPGVREPAPVFKHGALRDSATLEVSLQAMLMCLIENISASADSFVETAVALAARRKGPDGEPLSTDDEVLGPLLYIARQAMKMRASAHQRELLLAVVPKPK